ncbi:oligosaccharide flippase family protein [Bacillus sp. Bva_UNVM-123]|uniref:putative polysaccharide biosynthesis protein n=1 Tax=Bacillus sp. Bva_UNVM-123 TaxID=2829798 RepID=UPI00391F94CB
MQSKDIFKGAFILTIAALIVKILSAVYRVPFQNIVGDVGFYIYQQVYPFYGVALLLSTQGFPVVISKLYAEQVTRKDKQAVGNLFMIAAIILTFIGLLGFLFLYLGADWLAAKMDDPQLASLLKVISIVFLIFPIVSLLRGYFQGKGNMVPTAVSQVGEQLFRVLTIFVAAIFLTRHGYHLYIVGSGAVFGAVAGGIVAVLILTLFWMRRKTEPTPFVSFDFKESVRMTKAILIQGFAICVSSLLLIFIQMADSLNLYSLLISSSYSTLDAKVIKGIYDRGQPLIQLGTVVATSMSLALVPIITREKINMQAEFIYEKISLALRIGLLIGVGATIGLWSIIKQTNILLFENSDGSDVLSVLSLLILLSSIIITTTGILQGLGIILFPANIILIGFGAKYMFNIMLVPAFGTMGAAIASCLSLSLIMLLLLLRLRIYMKKSIFEVRFLMIVGIAALSMFIVLKAYLYITGFIFTFGHERLNAGVQALTAVMLGGFTYLLIVLKGNTFKNEEIAMLPFGSKLMVLLPKRNRRWNNDEEN